MDHLATARDQGLPGDLVLEVDAQLAVLDQVGQERGDVLGVHLAGVGGCGGGGGGRGPSTVTPPWVTVSSARVSSQLPPCSAAMSTMTEPGDIPATISAVTSTGARFPGTRAVVITASLAATTRAIISRWRR